MKSERPWVLRGAAANRLGQHAPNHIASGSSESTSPLEPLVTNDDIEQAFHVTRRWIELERAAGRFPEPDVMLGRLPRWYAQTIRDWLSAKGGQS
jgi:hypothetical protein